MTLLDGLMVTEGPFMEELYRCCFTVTVTTKILGTLFTRQHIKRQLEIALGDQMQTNMTFSSK